ncbi:unnamed protein product, partial [Rotaria sp. Silwood1]
MENNPDDKDDDPIPQTPCSPPAPTTPFTPFPKEYPNEAAGTEAFFRMFPRRYDGDTAFFVGSLQDACKAAFSWKAVEDRRPVLVYLHHSKNDLDNIFCKGILSLGIITDYLIKNYIVWPWDVTLESNRA